MKSHIVTWAVSVVSACMIGAAWIQTHPMPKMVLVDIKTLFDEEARDFVSKAQGGSQNDQAAILEKVQQRTKLIEHSIQQLSAECRCAVVNSAAVVQLPPTARDAGIHDMTWRVREMLAQSDTR